MRTAAAFGLMLCVLASGAEARARFLPIDFGDKTFLSGINSHDEVAGFDTTTAYLRKRDGTVTTFVVPGALATETSALGDDGTVVGQFRANNAFAGYIRDPAGTITTFIVPGPILDTYVTSANAGLTIAGNAMDTSFKIHGFARTADGSFTLFDAPGAIETQAGHINDQGEISGYFFDAQNGLHGFLRDAAGGMTVVDVPGALATWVADVNNLGWATGSYRDGDGNHAFIRAPDGTLTTFGHKLDAAYIGDDGIVTGALRSKCAFVRHPDGTIRLFRMGVPGARNTAAGPINRHGVIIGSYTLGRNNGPATQHGFLRFP